MVPQVQLGLTRASSLCPLASRCSCVFGTFMTCVCLECMRTSSFLSRSPHEDTRRKGTERSSLGGGGGEKGRTREEGCLHARAAEKTEKEGEGKQPEGLRPRTKRAPEKSPIFLRACVVVYSQVRCLYGWPVRGSLSVSGEGRSKQRALRIRGTFSRLSTHQVSAGVYDSSLEHRWGVVVLRHFFSKPERHLFTV